MKIISIEEYQFEELNHKIDTLLTLNKNSNSTKKIGWINNNQFCEVLDISKRSAQNYRDKGLIPYSTAGGKVYYKIKDIEEFLSKNYTNK